MLYVKQCLAKITPVTACGILVGVLTLAASFGLSVSAPQKAAILVFGGALAVVLFAHGLTNAFHYLTPPTLTGLVTGAVGIAVAFGAPITKAQSEGVLQLVALFGGLLLVHGVVHTVARDKREPEAPKPLAVLAPLIEKVEVPVAAAGPSAAELKAAAQAGAEAAVAAVTGK